MPRGRKTAIMSRLTAEERETFKAWQRSTSVQENQCNQALWVKGNWRMRCLHETVAHPVQHLDILLSDVLGRHKAQGRTRHPFRNGLGIAAIIFVRLAIRLDKLRRHEFDRMAMRLEA